MDVLWKWDVSRVFRLPLESQTFMITTWKIYKMLIVRNEGLWVIVPVIRLLLMVLFFCYAP